ncbi:Spo0E like sporulation regulatory protein [Clostridium puniceum]|uniref:Spo0E like sporulation regulatory protein n=1 Tax=Clostridium puniceum TaxID=29367 RepID=A0A1S8TBF9_9CLOT|nr:aspartyl-phosphate phosphatase Spo0E family protein [Clostridium puniceum]OOM75120.1 Spo0E like sporulation regulatory protein [Clostridium puniceum]
MKYRLSVDETRNTLKYVDIETELNEKEVDSLITTIEGNNEITCGEDLAKILQIQGVKVNMITPGTQNYYVEAETIEIEELEYPKREGIMVKFKACDLNKSILEQAIDELREKMHLSILENGKESEITIEISQKLDSFIVAEMRSKL